MTEKVAHPIFRALAEAAGLDPTMTPNDIAIALHNWFDSVAENPRDPLWREVYYLLCEGSFDPDLHERSADACRAVQLRQQREGHGRTQ
jgi:hypothetical protein